MPRLHAPQLRHVLRFLPLESIPRLALVSSAYARMVASLDIPETAVIRASHYTSSAFFDLLFEKIC